MQRNRKPLVISLFVLFVALASIRWNVTQADSTNPIKRAQTPTFNREVVRIFQKSCQTCHHPGDIAPFSSPQLTDVTVDQNNNLVAAGAGFLPGADIEINGRSLQDTRAESVATKLLSSRSTRSFHRAFQAWWIWW